MNFMVYDLTLLAFFAIFIAIFLYSNKKNLKKEGLLFLYKADWGIKLINKVGTKYKRTLDFLSYVSIGIGYILMATMIYLFGKIVYIYISLPEVVKAVKVPPIIPLVPYLPQLFKLDFLPDFYFTYWIVILAIIAITHEFAHGIFAAANKVRIKSTGFGFFPFFLPVFLAAFVEQDDKDMVRKSKFTQMAILSAGTFANILTAIFFFGVLLVFFSLMFTPAGVIFNSYATAIVPVSNIDSINGIDLVDHDYVEVMKLIDKEGFSDIKIGEENYLGVKDISGDGNLALLYYDAPAINAKLQGAIFEVNGVNVLNKVELQMELEKYSPGETISIKTKGDEFLEYDITLEQNPYTKSGWLGIEFNEQRRQGVIGKVYSWLASFKDAHTYYEPKYDGWSDFVYNLLWWLVLISLSVALVNMLPVGMFDGGRFFYLTVLGITGSKKFANRSFAFVTYLFLFLLFLVMAFWIKNFFF
jgi:membrane-associated protease RseP (regulator of RpoE activity)